MIKLLGSFCVFAAGGIVWSVRRRERRKQRLLLSELIAALGRMETEIRLTRMCLPQLLKLLAAERCREVSAFLTAVSQGLAAGKTPAAVWKQAVAELDLPEESRQTILRLAETMQGDETSICKGIALAGKKLKNSLDRMEDQRQEEDRRATALLFSATALVVILLI